MIMGRDILTDATELPVTYPTLRDILRVALRLTNTPVGHTQLGQNESASSSKSEAHASMVKFKLSNGVPLEKFATPIIINNKQYFSGFTCRCGYNVGWRTGIDVETLKIIKVWSCDRCGLFYRLDTETLKVYENELPKVITALFAPEGAEIINEVQA